MFTKALGKFAGSLNYSDLPAEVVEIVKLHLLDTLSAAMAAVRLDRVRIIDQVFATPGDVRVWGARDRRSLRDATILNSFRSHASYLDDGDRFSGAHPGCVVIPPLLALSSQHEYDGKQLIAAIVVGYEILLRVGQSIYPSTVARGFQSTAVLGALGPAAGCANLLGLGVDASTDAIGIAANLGAGLKEALKASESQPIQVARAAEGGLIAALAAQQGLRGSREIIETGFIKAYADGANFEASVSRLGHVFAISETYVKLHGGCRGCHAAIDVVDMLLQSNENIDNIRQIDISVDTVTFAGENHYPKSGDEAQFNIPFAVSLALNKRDTSPFQFTDENLKDRRIADFMKKVAVKADQELDRHLPDKRGAAATISFSDGTRISGAVDNAKGEPEFPLSFSDLEQKFRSLARPVLGSSTDRVLELVMSLESSKNMFSLLSYLIPPATAGADVQRWPGHRN